MMASADVLPRLQQRALEADHIVNELKAQLQQLKYFSNASSMVFFFFSNILQLNVAY